jgi:hypothetical protein
MRLAPKIRTKTLPKFSMFVIVGVVRRLCSQLQSSPPVRLSPLLRLQLRSLVICVSVVLPLPFQSTGPRAGIGVAQNPSAFE